MQKTENFTTFTVLNTKTNKTAAKSIIDICGKNAITKSYSNLFLNAGEKKLNCHYPCGVVFTLDIVEDVQFENLTIGTGVFINNIINSKNDITFSFDSIISKNTEESEETKENIIYCSCGGFKTRLSGNWRNDLISPEIPEVEFTLNTTEKDLSQVVSSVFDYISDEDYKYAMTFLHLEKDNGQVKAIGTDGRRLALNKLEATEIENFEKCDISRNVAKYLLKFKSDAVCSIGYDASTTCIKNSAVTIYCSNNRNEFPAWKRVIPEYASNYEFVVNAEPKKFENIYQAVKDNKYKKVIFTISDDGAMLDAGCGSQNFPEYAGHFDFPFKFAMNFGYFMDCLKAAGKGFVKVIGHPTDPTNRAILQTCPEHPYWLSVIMPMSMN